MTGTLCIYIHLDIGSVYINSGVGAPKNVCLTALQT